MGAFSFKKEDKKKKDSGEKKSKDAKKVEAGESSTVVLKIDLHCEGCANKIKSSIRKFKGVESIKIDMEGNKVTVTGNVDPASVKERVEKKTKKKVEIISPSPKKDEKKADDKPSEKKEDKKGKSGETDTKEKKDKDDKKGKSGETDTKEKKDKDGEKKKEDVKVVDGSRSIEVVNNFAYNGQIPSTYSMPIYNQSYYNQDYGISTSDHGFGYNGYYNHGYPMQYPNGYPMQYSNGPPPPPPMYLHDPRVPGMFSDENPNAACSIM